MNSEVDIKMLTSVSQFIGKRIKCGGRVSILAVEPKDMTWEEFVNNVFNYMVEQFIIEKYDTDEFYIGMNWIKKQHWRG